jgi:hypothetical protein
MVRFEMRVTISERPRLFIMDCVVWERGALSYDLLLSNTTALKTGLIVFVHDNLLRDVIIGRQALLAAGTTDYRGEPRAIVGAIIDEEEDQQLHERISPIESLREAMKPAELTDDPLVNEEIAGPLGAVFGPLAKEPANVPPLEFDINEDLVKVKTYGEVKPTKLASVSPRQSDVMQAHFKELKELGLSLSCSEI